MCFVFLGRLFWCIAEFHDLFCGEVVGSTRDLQFALQWGGGEVYDAQPGGGIHSYYSLFIWTHTVVFAQGLTVVYGQILEGGICRHQWSVIRASYQGFCRGIGDSILPQQAAELIHMLATALLHFHISWAKFFRKQCHIFCKTRDLL